MQSKYKKLNFKNVVVLSVMFIQNTICAQGYLGLHNSNFSGISSAEYNPASTASSRLKWDIRLAGIGIYAYEEYFFLKNESVISLLNKKEFVFIDSVSNYSSAATGDYSLTNGNTMPVSTTAIYDFFDNHSPFNTIFNTTIQGPGLMIKKDNFGFGLFSNFKMTTSAIGLDPMLNFDTISQLSHNIKYSINPMQVNIASYSEIGLNFSYKKEMSGNANLALGINAKLLLGHDAFYLNSTKMAIFYKNKDTSSALQGAIDIGYSTGVSQDMKKYNIGVQGVGFGFDIGAHYIIPSESDKDISKIKVGIAIKDIGWINYNQNAETHQYAVTADTVRLINEAYKKIVGYKDLAQVLSYHAYGDSSASLQSTSLMMGMPLSFSLNFDYGFTKNFFIQGLFQRRLHVFEHQIQASNLISITPRFESKWIEAGLPINVVEDNLIGVGLYLRLAWFTIGTDHLNTILFKQNVFQGSDIYMNIRIFPIDKKESKTSSSKRGKRGRSRDFGCFF
jgi:hypothetical protein